jgi:hypothetical protein
VAVFKRLVLISGNLSENSGEGPTGGKMLGV